MTDSETDLHLTTGTNSMKIKHMQNKNGIYRGDSLSPLLFCIAPFALSSALQETITGYKFKNDTLKINHSLYADNLELITRNGEELKEQLKLVEQFSDNINMEFNLNKCSMTTCS